MRQKEKTLPKVEVKAFEEAVRVNGVSVGNDNVGCYCLCQGEEREES